jgi:hypothetical protein
MMAKKIRNWIFLGDAKVWGKTIDELISTDIEKI